MSAIMTAVMVFVGLLLLLAEAVALVVIGVAEAAFAIATVMNTKNGHRN